MTIEQFKYTPYSAIFLYSEQEQEPLFQIFLILPRELKQMITSPKTGSFLEGVMKSYDAPVTDTLSLSLSVLQVALGTKSLAQLASLVSSNVKLPNDRSQKIAAEIERELFSPIMLEYNQFIASQKKQSEGTGKTTAQSMGARNVLDLKSQPKPPLPPPIPPSKFSPPK